MKRDFLAIVVLFYVLLVNFKQALCDPVLTCTQDRLVLGEDTPFTIKCTVTGTNQVDGVVTWTLDRTPVKNDSINTIVTKKDKTPFTSTLYAKKPSTTRFGELIYYVIHFMVQNKSKADSNLPILVLKDTSVPTPTVGNGTDMAIVKAEFGDTALLQCIVTFDNSKALPSLFHEQQVTVSWIKKSTDEITNPGKQFSYKTTKKGIQKEVLNLTVIVGKSSDGGTYACQVKFAVGEDKKKAESICRTATTELQIKPYLPEEVKEKEVKKNAGDDVVLKCDIVGYPIVYKWLDEKRKQIDSKKHSRFVVKGNVLTIKDIGYGDRKTYICVGKFEDGKDPLEQKIILRVKDPLAALWPFIGILAEAILIALIVWVSYYYKKKKATDTDGDTTGIINVDPNDTSTTAN